MAKTTLTFNVVHFDTETSKRRNVSVTGLLHTRTKPYVDTFTVDESATVWADTQTPCDAKLDNRDLLMAAQNMYKFSKSTRSK